MKINATQSDVVEPGQSDVAAVPHLLGVPGGTIFFLFFCKWGHFFASVGGGRIDSWCA